MYGYPTVRSVMYQGNEPYLCVAHITERRWVQPLRLVAGFIGGPMIMSAAKEVSDPLKSNLVYASGLGMSIWSLAIYYYANKEMNKVKQ